MSKNNFSSSIENSLEGRSKLSESSTFSEISKEPTKKKSNAGRKTLAASKKKKQMVLTLTPETYNKLLKWAETKARTAPNYVSEFVEEHINEITK